MEIEQITNLVQSWLNVHGSSWMPITEMPDVDYSEALKSGVLISRKKGNEFYITLPHYKEMEYFIARNICARLYSPNVVDHSIVENLIDDYEKETSAKNNMSFKFCDEQREGIHTLVEARVGILTGGPGTGKTSVLQCVAYVLKKISGRHITIAFTAPTGKAARRITEASGYPATTIQKYIGGCTDEDVIIKCPDYIICDEFSMADEELLNAMLKSLMPASNILLVGDVDQLPSVGIGAVLRDLIDSNVIPYVQLVQTFRQDNSSVLFNNIKIANSGGHIPFEDGSDFKNIRTESNIMDNVINEYLEGLDKYKADNIVILTAYRKKGEICSERLNERIQSIINPKNNGKPYLKTTVIRDGGRKLPIVFKVDDPVMQLVNNKNVANGDVGKIVKIEDGTVTVEFSDCILDYRGKRLNELDLAYALSVHKSQGTEYKCVIFPILNENKNLDRNMVYTAISRAKKYCVVIGENQVVQNACKIQSSWNRITFLCEEIEAYNRALEIRLQLINDASTNN